MAKAGQTAWLLTWEWMSPDAAKQEKIAAVLSARLDERCVQNLTELLYLHTTGSLPEVLAGVKNRQNRSYRCRQATVEGTAQAEVFDCGHNPWLSARKVDRLCAVEIADGSQRVTWYERAAFTFRDGRVTRVREARKVEVSRRRDRLLWVIGD